MTEGQIGVLFWVAVIIVILAVTTHHGHDPNSPDCFPPRDAFPTSDDPAYYRVDHTVPEWCHP
jgi:hypothetical protein